MTSAVGTVEFLDVKVKVKQSQYRPGQAQKAPVGRDSKLP